MYSLLQLKCMVTCLFFAHTHTHTHTVGKLMDMHGEGVGAKVERGYEPPVQQSV